MKRFEDHIRLHWGKSVNGGTNNMLTTGSSLPRKTEDLKANTPVWNSYYWQVASGDQIYKYFKGHDGVGGGGSKSLKSLQRQNAGYYQIDEFASMATYFRKMRLSESPVTTDGNRDFSEMAYVFSNTDEHDWAEDKHPEIGRASCRERV